MLYRSLILFLFLIPSLIFSQNEEINSHLEGGNRAATFADRQQEWNAALGELLLESPSKSRCLAIGFLLQEMGEFPQALFYLKSAINLAPYDSTIQSRIEALELQMGVPFTSPSLLLRAAPFFLKVLTLVFVLLGMGLYFYKGWKYRKEVCWTFLIGSWTILLLILISYVWVPKSALLLQPSFIYKDPVDLEKEVLEPLVAGEEVQIVGIEGNFFNIYSPNQKVYGWISKNFVHPF